MSRLVLAGRLVFGAWMLANGANHFFLHLWPEPAGHEPLSVQLMTALVDSRLIEVALAIQLVTGALILAGLLVPLALCVVAPVSTCALYWSAILEHRPLGAVLALAAFALNGLLMLAYLDAYRGMLQRRAPTLGEEGSASFEALYVDPRGRTSRGAFIAALIPVLATAALYGVLVKGRNAEWCLVALTFPALMLHARRLHDLGQTAWLLVAPAVLLAAMFWFRLFDPAAALARPVTLAALAVCAGFILWGLAGRGRAEANRFGERAAA